MSLLEFVMPYRNFIKYLEYFCSKTAINNELQMNYSYVYLDKKKQENLSNNNKILFIATATNFELLNS